MCSICFFFKQNTAYDVRISDWSSDVCSSDLDVLCAHLCALRSLRTDCFTLSPRLRGSEFSSLLPAVTAEVGAFHRLGQPHVSQQNHGQEHEVQRRPGLKLEVVRKRSDRKSVVEGKGVSVRVDLGGRRYIKTKKK